MTVGAQVRQTVAALKGSRATIRLYAEHSRHEETRSAYRQAFDIVSAVLSDLEKRLQEIEHEEPQYKGN